MEADRHTGVTAYWRHPRQGFSGFQPQKLWLSDGALQVDHE
jgi:hypothetical protein